MTTKQRRSRFRRSTHDLRLKIAILESGRTQREISITARIGENRLSQLVGRRGSPATADEKGLLAKALDRPIADLFDVEPAPAAEPVSDDVARTA